ncbi:MAG: hypothetical protein H6644_19300 [Caldilineaceae bacterium]|nr:hypothetical protein [Caldilineaceae bacterium]
MQQQRRREMALTMMKSSPPAARGMSVTEISIKNTFPERGRCGACAPGATP